ncbi:MAG TPA: hypothetical protein VFF11_15105, partial [Candidatus Binatia bacterium]|nr:hypothetical protein [Candidatus Binatia bacterium]
KGYHALTATLALDLVSNEFNLQATGFALPVSPARARGLPPVRAVLQVRGNPDSFTLEQLQLESPFAQATLTNALGIKRSGELLDQAARLKLSVDLSRVPGLSMTGRIGGALSVGLPADRQPVAHFSLEGTRLGAFGFTAKSVRVNGKFDWPWFTFDSLKVNLDDGSELSAGGQFDFVSNTLHETRWRASGAFLKSFLPGLDYTTLRAFGTVEGPLTNLTQSGEMAVDDLQTGFTPLKPLQVSGNWQAEGWKLTSAQVKLAAGDAVLSAEGSLDLISLKQRGVDGLLKDLSLTRNGEEIYALQQPCPISFHRLSPDGKSPRWQLQVDHFDWRGHDKELALTTRLDWPATGAMAL